MKPKCQVCEIELSLDSVRHFRTVCNQHLSENTGPEPPFCEECYSGKYMVPHRVGKKGIIYRCQECYRWGQIRSGNQRFTGERGSEIIPWSYMDLHMGILSMESSAWMKSTGAGWKDTHRCRRYTVDPLNQYEERILEEALVPTLIYL